MSAAYARHAEAYRKQAVLTASPGQLVLMLYDGILRFLMQAQDAHSEEESARRIERIHTSLEKACNIILELQSNLDLDRGGDYAENLDRLYDYYHRRLVEANLRKDMEPVVEVEGLVRQLRDAWAEMLLSADLGDSSQPRAAGY